MGVDAAIFAKKAKKYYYFDRFFIIQRYQDWAQGEDWDKCEWVISRYHNRQTKEELIPFLNINIKAWENSDFSDFDKERYCTRLRSIIEFVETFPDDEFIIDLDCSGDWSELTHQNEKWKPENEKINI